MVPWPRAPCRHRRCAPRARGDGPSQVRAGFQRETVLPAPAGMVPPGTTAGRPSPRAPRARGDGPRDRRPTGGTPRCSPRPRGWSREDLDVNVRLPVLPAPAGMVPLQQRRRRDEEGAPRARGDGPGARGYPEQCRQCSPRPRGWSRARHALAPAGGVLPAPTGMVPPRRRPACPLTGAPRARGDGPLRTSTLKDRGKCSPRPRGWSPAPPLPAQGGDVLPAPAGMVPRR